VLHVWADLLPYMLLITSESLSVFFTIYLLHVSSSNVSPHLSGLNKLFPHLLPYHFQNITNACSAHIHRLPTLLVALHINILHYFNLALHTLCHRLTSPLYIHITRLGNGLDAA